jgi:hypothetical protein
MSVNRTEFVKVSHLWNSLYTGDSLCLCGEIGKRWGVRRWIGLGWKDSPLSRSDAMCARESTSC